jgi:nucleoside-diphosphate-sugar epimerase
MAAGERLVSLAGKRSEVPIAIARPCEIIGPNQGPINIVPRTIKMIKERRPPIVYSKKGERYRDWLHILDLCSALDLIIKSITGKVGPTLSEDHHDEHNPPGKTVISGTSVGTTPSVVSKIGKQHTPIISGVTIMNITAENRESLNTLVEMVIDIISSDLPLQERKDPTYSDLGYNPSGKKITYHGWQAKFTDIKEVIRSTIDWYNEHPEIIDSVPSDRLRP